MGKPLVMGRKTFESIGRVLEGRDVIVVTRQPDFAPDRVFVAPDFEAALKLAESRAKARDADEICIVGGGEIYAAAMPFTDRLYVTEVAAAPEGDTFFPEIPPAEWAAISREPIARSEGDTATGEHIVYERRR